MDSPRAGGSTPPPAPDMPEPGREPVASKMQRGANQRVLFPRWRFGDTCQGSLSLVALPQELPSAFITRGARRSAPPRPSPPRPRDIPVSARRTSGPPLEVHRAAAGTSPGNSEEGTPRRGIPFLHGDSHRLRGLGVLWREVGAATPRPAQAVWEMPGPAGEGSLSLREAPSAERSKSFVQGKRERPRSLPRARQRPRTPPAPGMGEDLGGGLSRGLRGPRPASADQRRGLHL